MSSQSLKNLTIFYFAQSLHANSHPQEKQMCQILEKSVKYFLTYAPSKNGNFTPKMSKKLEWAFHGLSPKNPILHFLQV